MSLVRRALFAAFLPLSAFVTGCGSEAPKKAEVRPVRTVVVDPRPIEDDRRAVGEIRPRQESDIGFRVAGKVVTRFVDVGFSVKKGDLIARLDDQDFANKLRSAEADLSSAEASFTESKAAEERQRQLLGSGTGTRANYDVALRNLRAAEAKVASAKAALDLARDQQRYAELSADFDGVVTAVGAEPGQVVSVGQMIIKLAPPQNKDAVFAISESAFRERPVGDKPEVFISLLSDPGVTASGVVREVSPVADPATRTYQVKVTIADPPEQMRFGASVVGRLKATTAPVVVLPGSALFEKGGKPAVWVYQRDGKVMLKPVVVSRFETDRVVLAEGLVKGDIVVTAGVNRLREGQQVRLLDGAAAADGKKS